MTKTITGNDIVTALRGAIEHRGLDYVYSTGSGECHYRDSDTDEPSCVFGVAFDSLGILPPATEEYDIEGQGVRSLMRQIEQDADVVFAVSEDETRLFSRVQTKQDDRFPYREVLKVLDEGLATIEAGGHLAWG